VFDVAMPLFETVDVRRGLAAGISAYKARPVLTFEGRVGDATEAPRIASKVA
jgi:hypothetical protein